MAAHSKIDGPELGACRRACVPVASSFDDGLAACPACTPSFDFLVVNSQLNYLGPLVFVLHVILFSYHHLHDSVFNFVLINILYINYIHYRVFNYDWLILNWWCASHSQYYDFFFFSSCSILFDVFCIKISRVFVK